MNGNHSMLLGYKFVCSLWKVVCIERLKKFTSVHSTSKICPKGIIIDL